MTTQTITPELASDAKPAPRKGPLIAVGALLVTLTNAVIFVLPPLLPIMQAHFGLTSVAATTWIYTALTLGGGAGFILLPRLADVFGDRNATVFASGSLALGALIPAVGDSYPALLVGTTFMGVGGAAQLLPLGFLRRNLAENGIQTAVSVLIVATGSGIFVGVMGGGLIVEDLSLTSFFYILAAACAATTLVSFLVIAHTSDSQPRGRIGAVGTVWMIAWVAAILLSLTQGLVWGGGALIPLVAGIVGGVAWIRVQRRSSSPVIDSALLKAPFVTTACISIALFAAVNAAFLLLLSTYSQTDPHSLPAGDAYGLGLSALQTGALMLPFAAMFLVGGRLTDRPIYEGRGSTVLVLAAVSSAAGLGWLALAHDHSWYYLVGAALVGLGCSVGYSATFTLVQIVVPEEKSGMAAGVAGTAMAVGFAFGTALVSGVLSAAVIHVPGSDVTVPQESLYGTGYWIAGGLAVLIVIAVRISKARSNSQKTKEREMNTDNVEYSTFTGWVTPPRDVQPALNEEITCDVAVVGGGLGGMSTALRLAERGQDVVLLEGKFCGHGSSSRNAGQVAGAPGGDIQMLNILFGKRLPGFVQFAENAAHFLENLVDRFEIDCDYERTGNVCVAVSRGQMGRVRRVTKILQRCGAKVEIGTSAELGIPRGFVGGMREAVGGQMNPGKFTLAIRRILLSSKARVFEQTRVTDITNDGDGVTIQTSGGTVRARKVVLATNAFAGDLAITPKWLSAPIWVTELETEPIDPERLAALGWTSRSGVVTQHNFMENYRLTPQNTIVFGVRKLERGPSYPLPSRAPDPAIVAELARGFAMRFPALSDVAVARAWGGWIGITSTFLPLAGNINDDVIYSLACNGHGLAQAPYVGSLIADLIVDGSKHEDLETLWQRKPKFMRPIMMSAAGLKAVWAVDRFNDRINGSRRNAEKGAVPVS
ncbi:MAG: FAD-dependent oxidoreductase [Nocardiaceae bacterium]|nr:FAD-dependent oxidoreductase [Nocardiaceae bacterium]